MVRARAFLPAERSSLPFHVPYLSQASPRASYYRAASFAWSSAFLRRRLQIAFQYGCRRGIRQVHALDMYDPVIRLQLYVFASDVKSTAFAIRPFVTDLAAGLRLVDADRHRPTFRTKQPFLD